MLKRLFDGEQIVELGAIVQTFDLLSWCLELELFELYEAVDLKSLVLGVNGGISTLLMCGGPMAWG